MDQGDISMETQLDSGWTSFEWKFELCKYNQMSSIDMIMSIAVGSCKRFMRHTFDCWIATEFHISCSIRKTSMGETLKLEI